ncbi:MAG: hypothetical protein AAGF29_09845 [Pseudomonadota bacterium]
MTAFNYRQDKARAAMSSFQHVQRDDIGVARSKADLDSGAWHDRYGHLLELEE